VNVVVEALRARDVERTRLVFGTVLSISPWRVDCVGSTVRAVSVADVLVGDKVVVVMAAGTAVILGRVR
jgi:hypothetical protein